MEESKDAHFPRKRLLHNSYILLSRLFSTAINQSFFFTRTPKHEVRKKNPPPKKNKNKKDNTTNGDQISVTHIIDWLMSSIQFLEQTRNKLLDDRNRDSFFSPTADSISIRIRCCNLRSKLLKQILLLLRFSKHESRDAIDRLSERESERESQRREEEGETREKRGGRKKTYQVDL